MISVEFLPLEPSFPEACDRQAPITLPRSSAIKADVTSRVQKQDLYFSAYLAAAFVQEDQEPEVLAKTVAMMHLPFSPLVTQSRHLSM